MATIGLQGLTFGDVLIRPEYSEISSRDEVRIRSNYLGGIRVPIISAPMDYVTGFKMAEEMYLLGAYGIVNRFGTEGRRDLDRLYDYGVAIGTKDWETNYNRIKDFSPHSVCIDVAHGHHKNVIDTIYKIRFAFPFTKIIAGNVATREGYQFLAQEGVDAIRVGIGAGSVCSTRENTGVGIPQLSAILDCASIKHKYPNVALIADGGIQNPGDIAKALAAGADAVMLGKMLAGHDETPGDVLDLGPGKYKTYRGQSLLGSNGHRNAPEGVEGLVEYKGPVEKTINSLMNYLRSSMSYVGAKNLEEFRERVQFMRVSPATQQENRTRI